MPRRMPWFRFYVEAPADRKIRRLRPEHRWVWVCVLCAARQSPTPGELWVAEGEPMTVDELADLAAVPAKTARAAIKHMTDLGLVAGDKPWIVPTWHERQFTSDTSTDRARASKQRRSNVAGNNVATLQNRSKQRSRNAPGNAPETETETELTPLPPKDSTRPVDNPARSPSHGHYPFTETPHIHPAVAQLHARLDAYNPEPK